MLFDASNLALFAIWNGVHGDSPNISIVFTCDIPCTQVKICLLKIKTRATSRLNETRCHGTIHQLRH